MPSELGGRGGGRLILNFWCERGGFEGGLIVGGEDLVWMGDKLVHGMGIGFGIRYVFCRVLCYLCRIVYRYGLRLEGWDAGTEGWMDEAFDVMLEFVWKSAAVGLGLGRDTIGIDVEDEDR